MDTTIAVRAWWGTKYASTTLRLWWEMLHVGNYSWQLSSKVPGIVCICDGMGWGDVALCALLGHSCGGGETTAAIDLSLFTSQKE